MGKPKGDHRNCGDMEQWLDDNGIEYEQLSPHHYRILGEVAIVDVWPSRMTVHVIQTESVDPNRYFRMSPRFDGDELRRVLLGQAWNN